MATIKSITDISQSKVLAEILPLESADMFWRYNHNIHTYDDIPKILVINNWDDYYNKNIPAWSLSALLNVLPDKLQIVLAINDFQGDGKKKYAIGSVEHDKYDCYADNPVDACYEHILKLNELNLL